MEKLPNYEIVKKLIGKVNPIGETREDDNRFENLKELIELTNNLLTDIHHIATSFINRPEYSLKRARNYANDFLKELEKELSNAKV